MDRGKHCLEILVGRSLSIRVRAQELHPRSQDQGHFPQARRDAVEELPIQKKRIIYASDDIENWVQKKVPNPQHMASIVGAESSVIVIKDKTENLSKWIRPQEFRKSSSFLSF
jgi:hypothetical protein